MRCGAAPLRAQWKILLTWEGLRVKKLRKICAEYALRRCAAARAMENTTYLTRLKSEKVAQNLRKIRAAPLRAQWKILLTSERLKSEKVAQNMRKICAAALRRCARNGKYYLLGKA